MRDKDYPFNIPEYDPDNPSPEALECLKHGWPVRPKRSAQLQTRIDSERRLLVQKGLLGVVLAVVAVVALVSFAAKVIGSLLFGAVAVVAGLAVLSALRPGR